MKKYFFTFLLIPITVLTVSNCSGTTSVSGTVSYSGSYTGSNTVVYVRGYTTNSRALGTPDYSTSISGAGNYTLDLDGYTGDLYVSAFMDVDNSGTGSSPTANDSLTDGVMSDPLGCYGTYTFTDGVDGSAVPTKITIEDEVTGIDFALEDTGTLKITMSTSGTGTLGVVNENANNSTFLFHCHVATTSTGEIFRLPVVVRNDWYVKVKYDGSDASLYGSSVNVTQNALTDISF
ncbi:MAG: hypothetical protein GY754_10885 [bacterium]|nr:hypothetical protein [bacterium]